MPFIKLQFKPGVSSLAALSFGIRKTGTLTVLDTWRVDLEAERV